MILAQLNSIFGKIEDAVLIGIILIAVAICVVIMLKYEQSRKALLYALGAMAIFVGTFSGIALAKEMRAESYVRGSLNGINITSQQRFAYSTNNIVFYEDNGKFVYDTTLVKVEEFNGIENEYKVLLNNHEIINAQITAGNIVAQITLDFYDTAGNVLCSSNLSIQIEFFADKTTLQLITENNTQAQYLEAYVKNNGLCITIQQQKEVN